MIPLGLKKVATMTFLQHKDRFLLLRRANPPNQGKYLPVGGKIEAFEDPRGSTIRECKEETGIEIENPSFCGILTESSPTSYNWISYIYKADIEDLVAPNCSEGRLEWIHEAQLSKIPIPPSNTYIYKYIKSNQHFILNAIYDKDLELVEMTEELSQQKMIFK